MGLGERAEKREGKSLEKQIRGIKSVKVFEKELQEDWKGDRKEGRENSKRKAGQCCMGLLR